MALSPALAAAPTAARTRIDRAAGQLVGSRCERCGVTAWPIRAVCHRCGAPAPAPARFGPAGELISQTVVWVARPGVEAPFTLAEVRLADGPRVFGHLRGPAPDGEGARAVMLRVGDEGATPPFWFVAEQALP